MGASVQPAPVVDGPRDLRDDPAWVAEQERRFDAQQKLRRASEQAGLFKELAEIGYEPPDGDAWNLPDQEITEIRRYLVTVRWPPDLLETFERQVADGTFGDVRPLSPLDIENLRQDYREFVKVEDEKWRLRIQRRAQREVHAEENAAGWPVPDDEDNVGSLADQLAQVREKPPQLVAGLIGARHNLSLTAQYKTGKTVFGMNVVRTLVDGDEFLERETRLPAGKTVAWWNGEMDRDDWEEYVAGMGIKNTDRVIPRHLRGRSVPILSDVAAEWTIAQLKADNVGVWWIDSWRVLCAWNAVHENDNTGGGQLTARIDEIKREAGVEVCGILVHTGRMRHDEGEERSRGMTALDDWVDARWVLTRQGNQRFFAASGRGIRWEGTGTALIFDEATKVTTLGSGDRRTQRDTAALLFIYNVLTQRGSLNTGDLKDALHTSGIDGMTNTDNKMAAIAAAVSSGVVARNKQGTANVYTAGRHPDAPLTGGMSWAASKNQ